MRLQIDAASLRAAGQRYGTASDLIRQRLEAGISAAALQIEYVGVGEIRAVTPIGTGDPDTNRQPGELRRRTRPVTVIEGTRIHTTIIQDAKSGTNQDGSGGGFPYALSVRFGRRAIGPTPIAPGSSNWSTGKLALRTPWGPRRFVKAAPGDDYVPKAFAPMRTGLRAVARRWGHEVLAGLLKGTR